MTTTKPFLGLVFFANSSVAQRHSRKKVSPFLDFDQLFQIVIKCFKWLLNNVL
jgi:hypothetical protein